LKRLADYTLWLERFTGILALISIVQGLFIYRQLKLGRDEFNSTHRPGIRLKHLWIIEPVQAGKEMSTKMQAAVAGKLRFVGFSICCATDRPDLESQK
jgi:hypothetical protein